MKALHKMQVDFMTGYLPAGVAGTADFIADNFGYLGVSPFGGFIFQGSIHLRDPRGSIYLGVTTSNSAPQAYPLSTIMKGADMEMQLDQIVIDQPIVAYPTSRALFRCIGSVTIYDQLPQKDFVTEFVAHENISKLNWGNVRSFGPGYNNTVIRAFGFDQPTRLDLFPRHGTEALMPTGIWGVVRDDAYMANLQLRECEIDIIYQAFEPDITMAVVVIPFSESVSAQGCIAVPLWDLILSDQRPLLPMPEPPKAVQLADHQINALVEPITVLQDIHIALQSIRQVLAANPANVTTLRQLVATYNFHPRAMAGWLTLADLGSFIVASHYTVDMTPGVGHVIEGTVEENDQSNGLIVFTDNGLISLSYNGPGVAVIKNCLRGPVFGIHATSCWGVGQFEVTGDYPDGPVFHVFKVRWNSFPFQLPN